MPMMTSQILSRYLKSETFFFPQIKKFIKGKKYFGSGGNL